MLLNEALKLGRQCCQVISTLSLTAIQSYADAKNACFSVPHRVCSLMNHRGEFGQTSRKVRPQRAHKSNWQSDCGSVWQTDRRRLREKVADTQASKSEACLRGGRQSKQNVWKQLNWSARYRNGKRTPPPAVSSTSTLYHCLSSSKPLCRAYRKQDWPPGGFVSVWICE